MAVTLDCIPDTHYRIIDPHRWESSFERIAPKEWRDPKDARQGVLPEGDDHGFLWRTNTFWFVRENNGGVRICSKTA